MFTFTHAAHLTPAGTSAEAVPDGGATTILIIILLIVAVLAARTAGQAIAPIAGIVKVVVTAGVAFLLLVSTVALAVVVLIGGI